MSDLSVQSTLAAILIMNDGECKLKAVYSNIFHLLYTICCLPNTNLSLYLPSQYVLTIQLKNTNLLLKRITHKLRTMR